MKCKHDWCERKKRYCKLSLLDATLINSGKESMLSKNLTARNAGAIYSASVCMICMCVLMLGAVHIFWPLYICTWCFFIAVYLSQRQHRAKPVHHDQSVSSLLLSSSLSSIDGDCPASSVCFSVRSNYLAVLSLHIYLVEMCQS